MAKQKIVSIEIELKDYEPIKFTMDEAKELYEQLKSLFGKKEVHHHHDRWWYRPYYTWCASDTSTVSTPTVSTPTVTTFSASDFVGKSVSSNKTNMKVSYNAA